MAKTVFVCGECGTTALRWTGKCNDCGSWNSLVEQLQEGSKSKGGATSNALKTTSLQDISSSQDEPRLDTKVEELNQVFGGGIVPGSLTLLAGEPGVGKSTLLLEMSANLAASGKVLYVSGEESVHQIKLRARRLDVDMSDLELVSSTDIDAVVATIQKHDYAFVVVDSIQTMQTEELRSNSGTVSQISGSTHKLQDVAKVKDTAILIVGHVTKEGSIAGPKILEHLVDVVLYLEGERFGSFKLLRGVKNRYGSTHEVGIFEMQERGMSPVKNPSERFLDERQPGDGSVVFATIEGTRALLVEVQALVSRSPFGYPKRTAVGFDLNRLNLLIAVLSRRAGIDLADKDVYVNIVGGMRLSEPAADLAVAMAIASAAKKKPIVEGSVVFGEVGLSGEIRSVSDSEKRIKEAKKLKFKQALAPRGKDTSKFIKPTKTLEEALKYGLSK